MIRKLTRQLDNNLIVFYFRKNNCIITIKLLKEMCIAIKMMNRWHFDVKI